MKTTLLAVLILASMAFSAHAEDFCVGESVVLTLSGSHYDVTIREIYQDGTANVEFQNGNTSTYNLSNLSEALPSLNGLSVNDKSVLTLSGSHYDVVIREIYKDRKVLVEFANGNTSTYDISNLSRAQYSMNGLRVNDAVVLTLSGSHYDVTIREIYQDGKVLVEFQNGNTSTYDISNLSRAQIFMNGLRVNDNVVLTLSGSHYNVTIREIYQDGKVLVEFENGNTSTYDISNLSKAITCTSTRECGMRERR